MYHFQNALKDTAASVLVTLLDLWLWGQLATML